MEHGGEGMIFSFQAENIYLIRVSWRYMKVLLGDLVERKRAARSSFLKMTYVGNLADKYGYNGCV